MNTNIIKERTPLFDNIKAVMLILVVMGHTLDPFIEQQDSLFRYIMQYIYLFHMPMFAFVTGYFTKNAEKAREGAVKKILIPYIVAQCAYMLVALLFISLGLVQYNADVFRASLLLPTSPLYYLLCVFFWKIFIKDLNKLRWPVLFSVVVGVLISIIQNDEFHIGIGAAFSLLIFFILGVKCTKENIKKIRKLPKIIGVIILCAGIIPAYFLPYNFRNIRFTYHYVGLNSGIGIVYRLLFYIIAVLMIFAIINVMPEKHNILSRIGENSLLVYIGSTFTAPYIYLFVARIFNLENYQWCNLIGIIVFSFIIALFFTQKWIKIIYDTVMNFICKIIFSNN